MRTIRMPGRQSELSWQHWDAVIIFYQSPDFTLKKLADVAWCDLVLACLNELITVLLKRIGIGEVLCFCLARACEKVCICLCIPALTIEQQHVIAFVEPSFRHNALAHLAAMLWLDSALQDARVERLLKLSIRNAFDEGATGPALLYRNSLRASDCAFKEWPGRIWCDK